LKDKIPAVLAGNGELVSLQVRGGHPVCKLLDPGKYANLTFKKRLLVEVILYLSVI
jgi:hypothetical protein